MHLDPFQVACLQKTNSVLIPGIASHILAQRSSCMTIKWWRNIHPKVKLIKSEQEIQASHSNLHFLNLL